MARRFGRNQKRAMRNQIQNQAELIERNKKQISLLREDLRQTNDVVNFTAEVLGHHFITLPVKTKEVKEIRDRFDCIIHRPVSFFDQHHVPAIVENALCSLETYEADLQVDKLRGMVHMRYSSTSGAVGYGLPDQVFHTLPEDQLIKLAYEQIGPEMAKLLVRNRKKAMHR